MSHPAAYALRGLRRRPGFVLVAVASLGLALGLATTTFAALDSVVHPSSPVNDPDRVFRVFMWGDGRSGHVSGLEKYRWLRRGAAFAERMAVTNYAYRGPVYAGDQSEEVGVLAVTPNFFDLLGVKPVAGRLFTPTTGTGDATVVISNRLWTLLYHRAPLDNAHLTVMGRTYTVIGVAPEGMPWWGGDGVWTLLPAASSLTVVDVPRPLPIVRLKSGVTRAQAVAQLRQIEDRLTEAYGRGLRDFQFVLSPMVGPEHKLGRLHVAMAGAALAVLLIACANLANLMLARGVVRRRELAVRLAVGASRGALVRLLVLEAAAVVVVGGAVGVVLAVWGVSILRHQVAPQVEWLGVLSVHLSWRVFAFGALATGITAVLVGLLPAVRASNVNVSEPLKDVAGPTTGRTRRPYGALVVAEVAASLTLLMAAGVLLRTAANVSRYEFGYDPDGLLTVPVWTPRAIRGDSGRRLLDDMADRVRQADGVVSVAAYGTMPGGVITSEEAIGPLGRAHMYRRSIPLVSPGFLSTLGIPMVAGRDFAEGDRHGTGAAIVDEEAARLLWPNGDAVGGQVKVGGYGRPGAWVTVVGVAERAQIDFQSIPFLPPEPGIYLVLPDSGTRLTHIVARVSGSPVSVATAIRRTLQGVSGRVWVRSWPAGFHNLVAAKWFLARLFAAISGFALALAAVGLYGVIAYATSQRMREMGVRAALGARATDLFRLVMRDAAVLVLAGTAIGGFAAMLAAPILGRWLYETPPTDAVALVSAETMLLLVAFAASLTPALRAMRADPLEILRAV